MADIIEKIDEAVKENKIMIFMKGNRSMPQCGFSAATVAIFDEIGEPYATADVLSDPELRDAIKRYSYWPTIRRSISTANSSAAAILFASCTRPASLSRW